VQNRPDVIGPAYSGERTVQRDFNTSAFVANKQYQYGNAGRNILRQRPHFNWDFSALKNFQLRERLRMQFRFEGFSFSNTPRFNVPGNTVGTAAFGVITGAGTPRNLQFRVEADLVGFAQHTAHPNVDRTIGQSVSTQRVSLLGVTPIIRVNPRPSVA
jgi:hypothetical protein